MVEAPGVFGIGFASVMLDVLERAVGPIGTAAAFNFFRPSGPNPSFAGLVGGYANLVGLAQAGGFPTGFPGVQVPWSDVNPQTSTGNSLYNGFTLTVTKRFSHGFEMVSGWTYSHTIDDSTDLSTLLNPQDNSNPNGERGNSDFDQRHRWITSAVYQTPYHQSDSALLEENSGELYGVTGDRSSFGAALQRAAWLRYELGLRVFHRPSLGPAERSRRSAGFPGTDHVAIHFRR